LPANAMTHRRPQAQRSGARSEAKPSEVKKKRS